MTEQHSLTLIGIKPSRVKSKSYILLGPLQPKFEGKSIFFRGKIPRAPENVRPCHTVENCFVHCYARPLQVMPAVTSTINAVQVYVTGNICK